MLASSAAASMPIAIRRYAMPCHALYLLAPCLLAKRRLDALLEARLDRLGALVPPTQAVRAQIFEGHGEVLGRQGFLPRLKWLSSDASRSLRRLDPGPDVPRVIPVRKTYIYISYHII